MEECPHCNKDVIDVRGPHPSAEDGYESFKIYVHEKESLGPFNEIVDDCIEQIK